MLDFAETLELIEKAQNDDKTAKEKLINENSPLIKSIVKRYKNKGVEYEDLYQIGSMGFLKAIQNFNKDYNVKFSTYAVPMIAGEIKRYLRDNGFIKVSRSVKQLSIQINKFIEDYMSTNYKSPEISVIAEHFNITAQETVFAMESSVQPLSLYTQVGGEGEDKTQMLIEKIPDDKPIDKQMDYFLLFDILKKLEPRDKKIIILRYFRDKTQREIADILGVSQVQVSRLENKILNEIMLQIPNCISNSQRIQEIHYKQVFTEKNSKPYLNYMSFFIDVPNDITDLPNEIKVYPLLIKPNDEIYSFDFRFDKIFIRKSGSDEQNIVGVATLKNGIDTNEFYRIYEVNSCSQIDYGLYAATFTDTYQSQKMNMNIYAMDGVMIFINEDKNENKSGNTSNA